VFGRNRFLSEIASQVRQTGPSGLSAEQARARLAEDGFNELPSPERRGLARIVRDVLSEPMFALLLAAGGVYFVLGDLAESITLLLFANVSVLIAVVQESRSERVLDALRELASPQALVIRDGQRLKIAGREVARGDLLLLAEGERVPADVVLVEGEGVEVDESLLTGESVPVRKRVVNEQDQREAPPGGDDLPFLYSGSLLVRGSGRAVARATGEQTQIGRIGRSLGSIVAEPPRLHAQTRRLVKIFGSAGIALSLLVVVLYATLRGSVMDGLLAGIAVGMSLLPEEFPLILTVFMVMGAWRISQARVLTRRAAAIESLGAATVLCTDKTGTLTHNRMTIVALRARADGADAGSIAELPEQWVAGQEGGAVPRGASRVIEGGLLASSRDALDPMDRAFHDLAATSLEESSAWLAAHALEREFGLTPELPAVTTICRNRKTGRLLAATKGAPEAVGTLCRLDDAQRRALAAEVDRMAAEGMRVLAVATADLENGATPQSPRDIGFRFLGLVGFTDPLRSGVSDAVADCRRAGIRVVMITGDYPVTARAIAREAGIDADVVVAGNELEALTDDELSLRAAACSVFARIQPTQKLRIVEALKAGGAVAARRARRHCDGRSRHRRRA